MQISKTGLRVRGGSRPGPFGLAAVALFACCLAALPARAAVDIQEVRSESGVTAWLVEDYTLPLITIRFAFRGGSAQDPEGKEGLASLMSGLFDEGAGALDSDEFQTRLDDAGAELRFDSGRDAIYGTMRLLEENKDEAFDLLKLAVNEPRFDPEPVDRIRAQLVSSVASDERDPSSIARQKFAEAIYGDHPYARRDDGTTESLKAITPADLETAHAKLFGRDNLFVAVVGAIDAGTVKTELDEIFGGLRQEADLTPVPDIDPQLDQTVLVDFAIPQTTLQFAYAGIERDDPQFFAAYLMNHALGGGSFSSRLFDEVRERRGLVYGIGSSLVNYDHANALVIGTGTDPAKAEDTLRIIREQVREMAENGPTDEELRKAKDYILGSYAINNLDSSRAIARTLVDLQLSDLGIDYIERREGLINGVTRDETAAAAKRLLESEPAVMILGPGEPNGG